jgi:hypothetical protein
MADYTRAHTIRELRACGWELLAKRERKGAIRR